MAKAICPKLYLAEKARSMWRLAWEACGKAHRMRRAVLALPQAGARFRTPLFAGERNAAPGARRIDRHGSELDGLEPDPQARRPPTGRLHRLQPRRAACAVRRVRRVMCHDADARRGAEGGR